VGAIDARRMWDKRGRHIPPNVRQAWVLDTFRVPSVSDLYVSGGLGSGKTTVGANVFLDGLAYNAQATSGAMLHYAIVSSDSKQLYRVTMEAFRGVFNAATGWRGPFDRNPQVLDWSKLHQRITLACGAVIDYASGANGAQALEGGEYSVVWPDEPALCREETQERVRERCREVIAGTVRGVISTGTPRPGHSLAWIHERYRDLDDGVPTPAGAVRVALPTRLNLANLPAGYYEKLLDMYSPQMAEAMLDGKFVTLGDKVYPNYDPAVGGNVIPYTFDEAKDVEVVWDGAFHRPYFGANQHPDDDTTVCFDELALAHMNIDEQAMALLERPWAPYIKRIIHDPATDAVQSTTGTSELAILRQTLKDHGIVPEFVCSTRKEDRIVTIRVERFRAEICSALGKRRFLVSEDVAARRYHKARDGKPVVGIHEALRTQPLTKGSDEPDRTRQWDYCSHPCDAHGYGAVWRNPVRIVDREGFHAAVASRRGDKPEGGRPLAVRRARSRARR